MVRQQMNDELERILKAKFVCNRGTTPTYGWRGLRKIQKITFLRIASDTTAI
jgi:hypothetical protein